MVSRTSLVAFLFTIITLAITQDSALDSETAPTNPTLAQAMQSLAASDPQPQISELASLAAATSTATGSANSASSCQCLMLGLWCGIRSGNSTLNAIVNVISTARITTTTMEPGMEPVLKMDKFRMERITMARGMALDLKVILTAWSELIMTENGMVLGLRIIIIIIEPDLNIDLKLWAAHAIGALSIISQRFLLPLQFSPVLEISREDEALSGASYEFLWLVRSRRRHNDPRGCCTLTFGRGEGGCLSMTNRNQHFRSFCLAFTLLYSGLLTSTRGIVVNHVFYTFWHFDSYAVLVEFQKLAFESLIVINSIFIFKSQVN